ncbi:uncharacterized protein EURHEDRAFT_410834 [Aspergillus ruber CBS 135680]|uniref:Uncharacterized protein n=1 Tax=Aspergillus ruber (strain CBS 135680) TaxID=1388766 RepID=A0A017SKB7_ASPRC|nr:uncharacterized protein EURHEDRAFT_410834 [Aspergillus ruber CBS 135680]EYE97039.1 hypothetical protein EURHEDRAFT_410834 [Aspergillus ruber CBS 135680]
MTATLKANERSDFASFLAKLASTHLNKDRPCQISLLVFHEFSRMNGAAEAMEIMLSHVEERYSKILRV